MANWEAASLLEHRGELDAARGAYHDLFWSLLKEGATEGAVNALRGGARVLRQKGEYEHAYELAGLSLEIAQRAGLLQAAARAANVMAVIRHSQEEWGEAEALYGRAMVMALDHGDDELIGLISQNLGVMANILGDLREARTRYLESLASFVRCGSERNAAITYHNLGMVCADLAEWFEAEIYFDRGIEIAERLGGFASLLASLYANRTESLLHLGDLAQAGVLLDRAEEIARRIESRSVLVDIARFRAERARRSGDLAEAERHLLSALEMAAEAGVHLGHAEATEELGRLRREQRRNAESRELLASALESFRRLRAERDVERVQAALAADDPTLAPPLPRPAG